MTTPRFPESGKGLRVRSSRCSRLSSTETRIQRAKSVKVLPELGQWRSSQSPFGSKTSARQSAGSLSLIPQTQGAPWSRQLRSLQHQIEPTRPHSLPLLLVRLLTAWRREPNYERRRHIPQRDDVIWVATYGTACLRLQSHHLSVLHQNMLKWRKINE